jgi:hypothetical protein
MGQSTEDVDMSREERITATYASPRDAIMHQGKVVSLLEARLADIRRDLTALLAEDYLSWSDVAEYADAAEYANAFLAAMNEK